MADELVFEETNDVTTSASGGDANRKMLLTGASLDTLTVSLSASQTLEVWMAADEDVCLSEEWDTGDIVTEINVVVANMAVSAKTQACRVNAAGDTVLESSAETVEQLLSTTGVFTFTDTAPEWAVGNVDDRLVIKLFFINNNTMAGQSVDVQVGDSDAEVTTQIQQYGTPNRTMLLGVGVG